MYKYYTDKLLPRKRYFDKALEDLSTLYVALMTAQKKEFDNEFINKTARLVPVLLLDTQDSSNSKNSVELASDLIFTLYRSIRDDYGFSYKKKIVLAEPAKLVVSNAISMIYTLDEPISKSSSTDFETNGKVEQAIINAIDQIKPHSFWLEREINAIEQKYKFNERTLIIVTYRSGLGGGSSPDIQSILKEWDFINLGIGRLHEDPEAVGVLSIERGSVIAALAVVATVAATILGIVLKAQDAKLKQQEIAKNAFNMKKLLAEESQADIDKIIEAQKNYPKEVAQEIANTILVKYEGINGEVATHSRKAIEKIVEMIFKGDSVEVKLLQPEAEQEDLLGQMITNQSTINNNEEELRLLDQEGYTQLIEAMATEDA